MAKRFVVCGAFGTLGGALSKTLSATGHHVVGIDMAPRPEFFSGEAIGGVDLTSEQQVVEAFEKAASAEGQFDGLVNVVGGFAWESIAGGVIDTWDKMYAVNLRTIAIACKTAVAHLPSGGAIVNVGAAAATQAAAGMGPYAAAKAGVMALTQSLADELRSTRIRVNAVLPTIIDTAQNRRDMPDAHFGTWVSPDAIARVIRFLLSEDGSSISGVGIPVSLP
ncbi:SDR family oxidoreductase [Novosphingobium olei]|uniref:SDR family oxidoreductase n=1 Tax=Novosphingobium olei TaxID=2728851 RepID=UPI00308F5DF5|nr:SDR family oxidoreductase [Novosphingobium olei]